MENYLPGQGYHPDEYTSTFQTPQRAAQLLKQFAVVGVTERHAAFSSALCNATGPQRSASEQLVVGCSPGDEKHKREDHLSWRVEDFPQSFVADMRALLPAAEVAIYYVAEAHAVR